MSAPLEEFFATCVREYLDNREFMAEYRRLYGSTLGLNTRSPIEQMVDKATGHDPHAAEWTPFLDFVRDHVWRPVLCYAARAPGGRDGRWPLRRAIRP